MYANIPEELVTALTVIGRGLELDPNYLSKPECPYTEPLRAALRSIFVAGTKHTVSVVNVFEGVEDIEQYDIIEKEIQELITKVKAFGLSSESLDPNDKIQYFKAYTGLMEKLISLKERNHNVKQMSEFQARVIDAIGAIDPDLREQFIANLSR